MDMKDPDPLVTTRSSRVKGRSPFTIIGMIVVAIVAAVLIYFAWHGWRAKGQPVPDVDKTTRPAALRWQPGPAAPAGPAAVDAAQV
jgi:flagellar basal body-associated protein FliL